MIFASANRSQTTARIACAQNLEPRSPQRPAPARAAFLRDLAASVVTLAALGALLLIIQGHGTRHLGRLDTPASIASATPARQAHAAAAAQPAPAPTLPRQPADEVAIPDADEERVAQAVVAFALSKVSPLQPEPIASIPLVNPTANLTARAPRANATPPSRSAKTQTAQRRTAARIPTGAGQAGFFQAEWTNPPRPSSVAATPKDHAALLEAMRFLPDKQKLASGAHSLVSGAKKTVGHGFSGLRAGANAVQEGARQALTRLW